MNPISLYSVCLSKIDLSEPDGGQHRLRAQLISDLFSRVITLEDMEMVLGEAIAHSSAEDQRIPIVQRVAEEIITAQDRTRERLILERLCMLIKHNRWQQAKSAASKEESRYQSFAYYTLGVECLKKENFDGAFEYMGLIPVDSPNGLQRQIQLLVEICQAQSI